MRPPLSCALLLCLASPLAAQADIRLRNAILAAEDARPATREGLGPLFSGLTSGDTVAQRIAVRGLGRQERPELVADIAPLLTAATASVRAEAANALGQAVARGGAGPVRRLLEDRLGLEDHPAVRGAIYRTLGRLGNPTETERQTTELLLVRGSHGPVGNAPIDVLEGVALGLAALYRRTAARAEPSVHAIERLVELTAPGQPSRVRRFAMAALVASGRADSGALLDALRDDEREVRRLAVFAAFAQDALPGRERIVNRAWADPDPGVRYDAVRAFGRRMRPRDGCAPLVRALSDPSPTVALLAIDLLGQCGAVAAPTLTRISGEPLTPTAWHRPAHALVSLAQVAPAQADSLLDPFHASDVWQARMYAATAAGLSRNTPVLRRLGGDPHPNVRETALAELSRLEGHAADALYIAALATDAYQVIRTAAMALDSTPAAEVALPALGRALERATRRREETSRDARMALLHAIGTIGGAAQVGGLRPYLTDFDPEVASRAAELLTRWTGTAHEARPRPLRPRPMPTWRELAAMDSLRAVLVMEGGGRIVLRLHPFDAPTNVSRFVRLARVGFFDGLTFHRVAPNFVVQGGSPGANEYVGDGPYTRDELGLLSNLRGTVGLSTRGRDTGDGQLYINLIDNLRLDHDYTVWAEVVEGMDAVDALLEGAVITRVELRRAD